MIGIVALVFALNWLTVDCWQHFGSKRIRCTRGIVRSISTNDEFIDSLLSTSLKISNHRFFFPGHHGEPVGRMRDLFSTNLLSLDLPELEEIGNIHVPEGPLLAAAERASKLFRAQRSWFLINGSTGGIHIALQALTKAYYARNKARSSTVPTFLISRDAHKSVLGGIELAGARALILPSEIDPIFAVPLGPRLETLLETIRREGSDLAGVVLTRPSYQGLAATSTTISLIADTCHQYDVPLLVDEAHGAHLNFLNNPALLSAVDCGADLVVQSAHKGLTSLTQTGLLHLGRDSIISEELVQRCYSLLTTTSPSALLMASLEATIDYFASTEGHSRLADAVAASSLLKSSLRLQGDGIFTLLDDSAAVAQRRLVVDPLKLSLRHNSASILALDELMCAEDGIYCELNLPQCLTFALGPISTTERLTPLEKSLLLRGRQLMGTAARTVPLSDSTPTESTAEPMVLIHPSRYEEAERISRPLSTDLIGWIAAETIAAYPPGLPLVVCGERITASHIATLQSLQASISTDSLGEGRWVTGSADPSLATLQVIPPTAADLPITNEDSNIARLSK